MDKNLQNIEDLFKKGLDGNEESPSENVWNNIDQSLEKEKSLKFRKKYHSLKKATAILLVVVALLSIYVLRNESQKQIEKEKNADVAKDEEVLNKENNPQPNNSTGTIFKKQQEKNTSLPGIEGKSKSTDGAANDSHLKNTANENRKSTTTNVSNATAIEEKNPASEPTEKKSRQPGDLAVPGKPEVDDLVGVNLDKSDGQPPAFIFKLPQMPSFHTLKDLNEITTVSPFVIPGKLTSNRSTIHISAPPRWYAGVFYSPTIPFSHLRDEDRNYGNPYSRELEKRESGSYSYSFGFSIGYRLTHKWSLQSGLNLSTLNIHVEPGKIYAERDDRGTVKYPINTSSGKGYILPSFSNNPRIGDSLFTRNSKHSLEYTGIPLAIKYHLGFGRLSANLLAGFSANFLSKGKISTEVKSGNESELEKTHEIHGLKPIYFNGLSGIGFDYNINKNIFLTFSPTINVAIDPINKNVPVRSYPGTIDFQLGLKTKF